MGEGPPDEEEIEQLGEIVRAGKRSAVLTAVFISTEPRPGIRSDRTTQRHQLE